VDLKKKSVGHWNHTVFPLEQFLKIYSGCTKSLGNLAIGKRFKLEYPKHKNRIVKTQFQKGHSEEYTRNCGEGSNFAKLDAG